MRVTSCIAAAALTGCAHLPPPVAPPGPGEPRAFVSIETRPAGARAVVKRDGEGRLACAETPCSFALPPGPAHIDLSRVGYSWQLQTFALADEEDRYAVQLQGGVSSWGWGFWGGILGMLVFIPGTVAAASAWDTDRGAVVALGIAALVSTALVLPPPHLASAQRRGDLPPPPAGGRSRAPSSLRTVA